MVGSTTVTNELTAGGKPRGEFQMPPLPGRLRRGPPWREGEIARPGLGRWQGGSKRRKFAGREASFLDPRLVAFG